MAIGLGRKGGSILNTVRVMEHTSNNDDRGAAVEATVQKMILSGEQYLKDHPEFEYNPLNYNVVDFLGGVVIGIKCEGDMDYNLLEAISQGIIPPTPDMYQQALGHLGMIYTNGRDGWCRSCEEEIPGTNYEITEEDVDYTIMVDKVQTGFDEELHGMIQNGTLESALHEIMECDCDDGDDQ